MEVKTTPPTEAELEARRAENARVSEEALAKAEEQAKRDAANGILPGIAGANEAVAKAIQEKLRNGGIQEGEIHVLKTA